MHPIWKPICPLVLAVSPFALAAGDPPKWITDGPYVDEATIGIDVPLEVLATKLFVEVEVGGQPRQFVFDTGSPSMISAALAEELNLEIVDRTKGRDAHGAVVDTGIVQADIRLGGTTFHNVPIFVAEFPETAQCLFDGVLGSELLPLCAWQIDLPDSRLRCNTALKALDHVGDSGRQTLHDFGYPHAPILDIHFARKARSKAMLDTGSPEYLAIAPGDLEGAKRNGGVGQTVSGYGSSGGSLGGRAPDRNQELVELKSLSIGTLSLGRVDATVRETAPSLIGASVLEHFIVTLDSRSQSAFFDSYRDGPYTRESFGFSLDFDGAVRVGRVWDDSPAAAAGLKVGQRVTSINGQAAETTCAGIRRAMQAVSVGDTIALGFDGETRSLRRARTIP